MPKVPVYDLAHNQVGEIELSEEVFGQEVNVGLLHQAVVRHLACQRLGTHSTKTRAMVRGGGKKPWRQKGTGHARSGSTRSPLWRGGGVVFGPHPRKYGFTMPRKQRHLAVKCALSDKVNENSLIVLDSFTMDAPKTKTVVKVLADFGIEEKALFVTCDREENVERSANNIPTAKAISTQSLNVYDILKYDKLFVTKDAIARIEEVLD